jgi:hypothetical protein
VILNHYPIYNSGKVIVTFLKEYTMDQELNQKLFDNLFGDIRWEQAISLLLGDQMLSEEQQAALDLASKDRSEPFVPLPVGYIGFQARTIRHGDGGCLGSRRRRRT